MSRILLLDACCSAENVNCEENELVACAGSETFGTLSKSCSGGFWTMEFCSEFNHNKCGCDIVELLHSVKMKMNSRQYPSGNLEKTTHLFPTVKNNLQRKIFFINKGTKS